MRRSKNKISRLDKAQDHMSLEPHHFQNREGFDILKELSERKYSRFKIIGNSSKFEIRGKSANILLAICIILITWFLFIILLQDFSDLVVWAVILGVYTGIILLLIFTPNSYTTSIDVLTKKIKIRTNNEFAKPFKKSYQLKFRDIEKIDYLLVDRRRRRRSDPVFHRIRLFARGQSKPISILGIPYGPFYFVNQKVLVYALFKIIQGEEEKMSK